MKISRWALLACTAAVLALPSCETDTSLSFLGYQIGQGALYDCNIHTVRVPIFQNRTYVRGLEFDLTRAIVREIELKTQYKVVGPDDDADTELSGTIVSFTKGTLNVNPLNEVREQETNLVVEVVWRNLRTGEVLSDPTRKPNGTTGPELPALPGTTPIAGAPPVISAPTAPGAVAVAPAVGPDGQPMPSKPAPRVIVGSLGDFIPEIGQSLTTAQKQNVDRLAVQIVSMMEKPW
jgi:hypothetical protein